MPFWKEYGDVCANITILRMILMLQFDESAELLTG
jgi:hypothetical protein